MLYWKSTGSKWAGKTMKPVKLNGDPDNMLAIACRRNGEPLDVGPAVVAAVDAGANINKKGAGGQTPLMAAVLNGNTMVAKVLLSLKADTSIAEDDGFTPIHAAGFQGRVHTCA
jgi:ankyrin repeat protein